ncbi:hypothetical protein M0G43_00835 [Subsaxibacter sp. CAU 1640]|uniref:hypothetical protein n=1 Tax=Subsaxibacter sp. CAU 1640 TaxID=2933271 RepID=UPI002006192F|nr:hypothetical protein [Subsaxibacter sp. CAU 1640]MCK7589109.1 hypothetical protein [Subsaxibacter sp. CAU 1640]
MKTSLNKYSIILLVIFVTLSCSKENNPIAVPEPTTQELLLGLWKVDSALAGEPYREFIYDSGDLILTFSENSILVENSSGMDVPFPFDELNVTYELNKLCDEIGNIDCDEDMKNDYLTFDNFNYQVLHPPMENILVFGNDPMHQFTFYLTRVIN